LGSVLELFRRTEAGALVGFEVYFMEQGDYAPKRIRVEKVNEDGHTLQVMDLGAKVLLEKRIFPGELTVGAATRSENDPVIRLLKQVKINPRPFLDPNLRDTQSEVDEFRSPPSRLGSFVPVRRSAPPVFPPERAGLLRRERPELGGGIRAATPSPMNQGPLPVRGEYMQRGRGQFRPFQPYFGGVRPVRVTPERPPDMREEGQHARPCGQFPFYGERRGGEMTEERHAGLIDRRNGNPGRFEQKAQWGEREDWPAREPFRERVGHLGRMMGQLDEDRGNHFQEFQEQLKEARRRNYQERGETEPERAAREEAELGRRRRMDQRQRGTGFGEEWGERLHEGRRDRAWGAGERRAGDRMRGTDFQISDEPEDEDIEEVGSGMEGVEDATGRFGKRESGESRRRRETKGDGLETRLAALEGDRTRIAALERDRAYDRARAGLNTELRRLQSGASPFEHTGLFSHIDKMVTLHEAPITHRGPMAVAGATSDILKVPHIKLSYLGDAVWEFTRRKCAEGGENLTDQQVVEIEAQVMEYFGKQKVEAAKVMDKAGINPGRGNR
jgi:hypothetical protein